MKRVTRLASMALMCVMIMLSMFTTAFGAVGDLTDTSTESLNDNQKNWIMENIVAANDQGVTGKSSWMKNYLTTKPEEAAKSSNAPIQIGVYSSTNNTVVTVYLKSGKNEVQLRDQVVSSVNNAKTVDDVSNVTDGLNISADTQGAAAMMQGFAPIISLVLGIIVTLITIGMTIFSSFDIAYIAFPVFRNKCEDAKVQGSGAMVKKGSNGESSLRFVTDDAQYAVQQGSIESGKSPWAIYFKKRVMSYILLAIILFILLTGNISLITNIALKVVSGIMDVLGGLA